ncbi:unnamed protein product [Rhizoctonia solani]|uniref:Protein kinase domain-containing protein n=1 Tax=Rhizoctonia solani TaxID=456999 RepID=A0A8H2XX66_9AGAM|nr:unnamed protein product [Rhizoctonia solani]
MQSPISPEEYQLYLVSPYMKNQDIKRYLKTYQTVPGSARLQMALDIARGLKYMHDGDELPGLEGKGLVHSALNIYNVLVKDSGRAVISGFGHAKVVSLKDFQASFTGDNSEYRYMGPEILDDAVLTFGSDIWSWAMTSLEILTDEPPFGAKTRGTKIIQMIGTDKRPERSNHPKIEEYDHSDEIWQLFEDCWKKQPGDRPSAREVVRRLRPLVRELGKKSDPNVQKPPPPTYPRTEYGQSDPTAQQIISTPGQHELGKPNKPIAEGRPPQPDSRGAEGEGNQEGRATQPVVPGSTPPPQGGPAQ